MEKQNRIPPIIHYCWFGGARKSKLIRRCIDSWQKTMPDYEIKCWNEKNFDINSISFVKQAIEKKKWAFASDYVRLHALYTEGGIYLDTDVEIYKSLDPFLQHKFFTGIDTRVIDGNTMFFIESAIIGSEKRHEYLAQCMEYYQNRDFILPNGEMDQTMIPDIISNILLSNNPKYEIRDIKQEFNDNFVIYPTSYFANSNCKTEEGLYAKHWNTFTWRDRGPIYSFCMKNDLMKLYYFLEMFRIRSQRILNNIFFNENPPDSQR